jgi:hypothetical protein
MRSFVPSCLRAHNAPQSSPAPIFTVLVVCEPRPDHTTVVLRGEFVGDLAGATRHGLLILRAAMAQRPHDPLGLQVFAADVALPVFALSCVGGAL